MSTLSLAEMTLGVRDALVAYGASGPEDAKGRLKAEVKAMFKGTLTDRNTHRNHLLFCTLACLLRDTRLSEALLTSVVDAVETLAGGAEALLLAAGPLFPKEYPLAVTTERGQKVLLVPYLLHLPVFRTWAAVAGLTASVRDGLVRLPLTLVHPPEAAALIRRHLLVCGRMLVARLGLLSARPYRQGDVLLSCYTNQQAESALGENSPLPVLAFASALRPQPPPSTPELNPDVLRALTEFTENMARVVIASLASEAPQAAPAAAAKRPSPHKPTVMRIVNLPDGTFTEVEMNEDGNAVGPSLANTSVSKRGLAGAGSAKEVDFSDRNKRLLAEFPVTLGANNNGGKRARWTLEMLVKAGALPPCFLRIMQRKRREDKAHLLDKERQLVLSVLSWLALDEEHLGQLAVDMSPASGEHAARAALKGQLRYYQSSRMVYGCVWAATNSLCAVSDIEDCGRCGSPLVYVARRLEPRAKVVHRTREA